MGHPPGNLPVDPTVGAASDPNQTHGQFLDPPMASTMSRPLSFSFSFSLSLYNGRLIVVGVALLSQHVLRWRRLANSARL